MTVKMELKDISSEFMLGRGKACIGIYLTSDRGEKFDSAETIFTWPEKDLIHRPEFVSSIHPHLIVGFLNDQDGINDNLQDGMAKVSFLGPPGEQFELPADEPFQLCWICFELNNRDLDIAVIDITESYGVFGLSRVIDQGRHLEVTFGEALVYGNADKPGHDPSFGTEPPSRQPTR